MARKVRNSLLDSKTARAQLKQRGKPYYVRLQPDLHLGFRKGKKEAKWALRRYLGRQDYEVETFADA